MDSCVSPHVPPSPSCHCHNMSNTTWSLCWQFCHSHINHTAGLTGPSSALFLAAPTSNTSAPFWGLHAHGALFSSISTNSRCSGMHQSHSVLGHHCSQAQCHPHQPSTSSLPAPHPFLGCFPCHCQILQVHLAGFVGNCMQLKPKFQGNDGSKNLESWRKSPYHSMVSCASAAGTKAGKSKPGCGAALGCGGRINGSKEPFMLCGSGFEKLNRLEKTLC